MARFIYVDQSICGIFHFSPKEAINKGWLRTFHQTLSRVSPSPSENECEESQRVCSKRSNVADNTRWPNKRDGGVVKCHHHQGKIVVYVVILWVTHPLFYFYFLLYTSSALHSQPELFYCYSQACCP